MTIWIKSKISKGQLKLQASAGSVLANKDTYYKVSGTFSNGQARGFIIVDNKLKWKGADNSVFLFGGVSDVKSNKACEIHYGLFKNGVLVTGAETPHTFPALARISTISIIGICVLDYDDELDVYARSDTDGTILSVASLNIVLWGEK